MSDDEKSLEGWTPEIPDGAALAEVVDAPSTTAATSPSTWTTAAGSRAISSTATATCTEPFVQMFASGEAAPFTIPYARIRAVRFTGRDTAAGNSYAAWLRQRQAAKAASGR